MNVEDDANSKSVLEHALQQAKAFGEKETEFVLNRASLPPYNPDTNDVSKIYDLAQLAHKDMWSELDPKSILLMAKNQEIYNQHKDGDRLPL